MSDSTPSPVSTETWTARLGEHVRTPLYRNGYLLVASSVLSSGLGVVYWWLAARLFDAETVGLGSAAIAAMILLSNLASFNLVNGLNRFVPRAGGATAKLVGSAYGIAALGSVVAGLIYLAGLGLWSPSLGFLRESPGMIAWFAVAVAAWSLFVLQDGALTGLRATGWVTIENLAYSVVKILVLLFLVDRAADASVFVAWTLPVVPLVMVVNYLLFRRLVPVHASSSDTAETLSRSLVGRFVIGDYSASLVWMGTTNVLPIIVLERVGAAQAAYFYLAWTVAYVLYLVGRNFGMSMLTETTREPTETDVLTYRTMRQAAIILVPAVVVVVAVAPLLLNVFGKDYSSEGAGLLRLLSLAALPSIVTTTYVALLRARRRMKAMVVFTSAMSVLVLPLSWVLLNTMGIVGVGVAWLVAHTLAAAVLSATELRNVFVAHMSPRLMSWLGRSREAAARSIGGRQASSTTRRVLAAAVDRMEVPPDWQALRVLGSVTDSQAVMVGPNRSDERAVVKFGASPTGVAALERASDALSAVVADQRLVQWRRLVPKLLGSGRTGETFYVIEEAVPGVRADRAGHEVVARVAAMRGSANVARQLSMLTPGPVGAATEWFEGRVEAIGLRLTAAGEGELLDRLDRLGEELCVTLGSVPTSLVHGDFWLGNVLVDPVTYDVTGVLDWDAVCPTGPADLDLISLMVSSRALATGRETGPTVLSLVGAAPWTSQERELLELSEDPSWASSTDAIRIAWLHSVALLFEQSSRYWPGTPWFMRNFGSILPNMARDGTRS